MSDRLRVLVLAYMISPVRGSEYAVAWNHIQAMRAHCDLTVLYGSAGPHMGDATDFDVPTFIDRSKPGDVAFHFVAEPPLARRLNALNRRGILTYSFYLAYRIWHRRALAEARWLMARESFDLIHYLGPIGYREPGYLWRIPLPYVWGPIGGATSFPWGFRSALPGKGRLRLIARTLGNAIQLRYSARVTKALRRADVLLSATTENQAIFRRMKGIESQHLPENGIEGAITLDTAKFPARPIRILWIGSLEARKGLILLIEAIGMLQDAQHVHVDILGEGPLRGELMLRAADLGISSRFEWHGQVSRQRVLDLLDNSHLHVITGLNEANTTSIWEALGRSVPVLTLDHCGMHDIIAPAYGIGIPVTQVEQSSQDMAAALQGLIDAPERLEAMARAIVTDCDRFRIIHRPHTFLNAYNAAIARYRTRTAG
ncbi:glycosyltransferase family 4 protein [Sphingomonas sp. Leaf30]|uniref:glycosyltransferase family 4 protein n=1 Tax=Sphingomonas sp. Leaf30 TaxID=1736213 RepID=UPI0009E9B05F|nr:glycosyltransferase family 4 protein [Sphingomonas sp. Leaf30]